MSEDRLQKIIARAGFASRREAEQMIRDGLVTVNGTVVTELGSRADPATDHIKVNGKLVTRAETHRYILLYKPKEVMTTVDDPQGRRTVVDLVRGIKERIFPVGRLDYHSEGLILLTNDGELAFRIAHPKHGSVKTYNVKVRGVPEERIVDKLRRGITIEGRRTMPCEIVRMRTTGLRDDQGNSWFEVSLREGRTQQIRKMFKAVGHPVAKLKRVAIGPISDSKLIAGEWRELTRSEIKSLSASTDPLGEPKPAKAPAREKAAARPARKPTTRARTSATRSPSKRRAEAAAPKRSRATKPPARKTAVGPRKKAATPRTAASTTRKTSATTRGKAAPADRGRKQTGTSGRNR